jgi:hypothetical protein
MTGGTVGIVLMAFTLLLPSLPSPAGSNFIEARLCASGRLIRIELPGQKDPDKQAPMPCHAVCARDTDDPVKGPKKLPKI